MDCKKKSSVERKLIEIRFKDLFLGPKEVRELFKINNRSDRRRRL